MTARDRTVILVVGLLVAIAAAWLLILSPRRAQVATLRTQAVEAQASMASAEVTYRTGRAAQAQYAADYATVVRLGKAVPADDDLASLVVQLQRASRQSGVRFSGLTRGQAAAATTAPTTTGTTTTPAPAAGSTTPAAGASATPTTADASGSSALPPGTTVGSAGLGTIALQATFRGRYLQLQGLVSRLRALTRTEGSKVTVRGRLLDLDSIGLAPADSGLPQLEATVSLTAYVLPEEEGLTGAQPAGAMTGSALSPTSAPVAQDPTITASIR